MLKEQAVEIKPIVWTPRPKFEGANLADPSIEPGRPCTGAPESGWALFKRNEYECWEALTECIQPPEPGLIPGRHGEDGWQWVEDESLVELLDSEGRVYGRSRPDSIETYEALSRYCNTVRGSLRHLPTIVGQIAKYNLSLSLMLDTDQCRFRALSLKRG